MNPRNCGELLLVRLKQLGVTHFFANPGTEFISVIQGFEMLPRESVPEPVLAPHELLAVSLAHGAYLSTGKPQAVMTHANVGAANALIGLIGAHRMQVPLIFISGATASTERGAGHRDKLIHWAQEEVSPSYRGAVKWEAEVRDPSTLCDLLDRAYAIAMTEPRGPVALRLSRDVLVAQTTATELPEIGVSAASPAAPDPGAMAELAARLAGCERPVIVTNRLGSNPSAVPFLVQAAERHSLGVVTPEDYYVSFPPRHPQHLGFVQSGLREADLVIALETDAPWFPLEKGPRAEAFVVHAGSDPLASGLSLRSHRGNMFITASPTLFLKSLSALAPAPEKILASRKSWLQKRRPECADEESTRLTAKTISREVGACLTERRLLVNELGLRPEQVLASRPGSYFRSGSASALGSGIGYALGAALLNPGLTAIAALGDGVSLLSPLPGALAFAAEKRLPLLLAVLDNGGYGSVATSVKNFYPQTPAEPALTRFPQRIHFDRFALLVGGSGVVAKTATELRAALKEGLSFTEKEKRPAVVHIIMEDGDPGAGCRLET